MRLNEKIAIVTGGGTGIGRAIALRFGLEGAAVVVAGRRLKPLVEVASELRELGSLAEVQTVDVEREDAVGELIRTTVESFGRLDILVNCAGAVVAREPVSSTNLENWRRTLDANLTSVFQVSRLAFPALRMSRGNIINVASVAGLKGVPGNTAYGVAKAGVVSLTRSMALECVESGVRVNAICPGYIETDLNHEFLTRLRETGEYAALAARLPMGLGRAEDVAWAAVYLASNEARWVNGVALPVDGGVMAGA